MQTISFKLEVFEGPMDLLLNLISKHKLNIYDIEISSLLEQYLAYLDQCREQDLELAGEFLEMGTADLHQNGFAAAPSGRCPKGKAGITGGTDRVCPL